MIFAMLGILASSHGAFAQNAGARGSGMLVDRFSIARDRVVALLKEIRQEREANPPVDLLAGLLTAGESQVLNPNLDAWISKLENAKIPEPVDQLLYDIPGRPVAALAVPETDTIKLSLPYFNQYGLSSEEAFILAFHEGGHLAPVPNDGLIHVPVFDDIGRKLLGLYRHLYPKEEFVSVDPRVTPALAAYLHDFQLEELDDRFGELLKKPNEELEGYTGTWKCVARSTYDTDRATRVSLFNFLPPNVENPMGAILPELLQFKIHKAHDGYALDVWSGHARCFWDGQQACELDRDPRLGLRKISSEKIGPSGGSSGFSSSANGYLDLNIYPRSGPAGWSLIGLSTPGISETPGTPVGLTCAKFDFESSPFLLCQATPHMGGFANPSAIGRPIEGAASSSSDYAHSYFLFSQDAGGKL